MEFRASKSFKVSKAFKEIFMEFKVIEVLEGLGAHELIELQKAQDCINN